MFLQESWIFGFGGAFLALTCPFMFPETLETDFPVAAQLNASVPNQHLPNKTSPFPSFFLSDICLFGLFFFLLYLMNDFVP